MGETGILGSEVGLLASCFGMTELDELPGTVLVRLLGSYGRGPQAARSIIARQRERGVLEARRHGRTTLYRLAGPVLAEFDEVSARSKEPQAAQGQWDGTFHALMPAAPESERAWRDQVRRVATAHGYRLLRPGVLVQVRDRSETIRALAPPPPDCSLLAAELRLSPEDARREARQMWELDEVAERLRAAIRDLSALGHPPVPFGQADLERFVRTVGPVYPLLMVAPALPSALVGDRWPLGELVETLGRVNGEWLPRVYALVREWVELTPGADAS